jgi:hypothetical protein
MFAAAIAAKYMLAIEALTDLRVAASVPLQMCACKVQLSAKVWLSAKDRCAHTAVEAICIESCHWVPTRQILTCCVEHIH